jgi:putative SOS response-associated peptidase YedK
MCGRYATTKSAAELVDEFDVMAPPEEELAPDYNVAPTKQVYAVLERTPRGADAGAPVERSLRSVRWGLVPSWAKDPSIGSRLINARVETVDQKPSFKRAFAQRRCVLPADGYYEWYLPDSPDAPRGKNGKPVKQPYFIHSADGGSLAMAGLYEFWRDESRDSGDPLAWLVTATVITTTATDDLGHIHDRSPMLVPREHLDRWLDPAVTEPAGLADLLVPAAPGVLEAYPVSTEVNSVGNNGPTLIEPLAAERS